MNFESFLGLSGCNLFGIVFIFSIMAPSAFAAEVPGKKTMNGTQTKPLSKAPPEIIFEGKFIRMVRKNGWEYAQRKGVTGVVAIVATTRDNRLILIEQERIPVGKRVVELPAGLAGDEPGTENETLAATALRELLEETGYHAESCVPLFSGPVSAGLTDETLSFFLVRDAELKEAGGGVEGEKIDVHAIPIAEVPAWLQSRKEKGAVVDPKVYTGLWFAQDSRK